MGRNVRNPLVKRPFNNRSVFAPNVPDISRLDIFRCRGLISDGLGMRQFNLSQSIQTSDSVSFIGNGFNCKQVTACCFLDIKSAFDMAWHLAILAALIKRGCPRYLVCLVHNFLSNRKGVFTHYGAHLSVNVDLGCPQVGCSLRSCETFSLSTF